MNTKHGRKSSDRYWDRDLNDWLRFTKEFDNVSVMGPTIRTRRLSHALWKSISAARHAGKGDFTPKECDQVRHLFRSLMDAYGFHSRRSMSDWGYNDRSFFPKARRQHAKG